jgi:hypothetical protein
MAETENNLVEVEILGIVTTAQYGSLNSGDILRTSPEFAKHLVEDCGAARYRAQEDAAPDEEEFEMPSIAHADPTPGAVVARRRRDAK